MSELFNRGNAYYQLKEYQQAFADCESTLELDPQFALAYFCKGLIHYKLKEYQQALADFEFTLELDSQFAPAYYSKGLIHLSLRNIKQAKTDFIKSREFDTTAIYAGWMIEWSTMCEELPDSEEIDRLEAIAAVDPQHYLAFICTAVVNYFRANYEEALANLEQSVTLNPDEWDAYFWQGMNLAKLGRDEEAIEAIEQALKLDLPPDLLYPLRWLEQERSEFYQQHALPLINRWMNDPDPN